MPILTGHQNWRFSGVSLHIIFENSDQKPKTKQLTGSNSNNTEMVEIEKI